MVKATHLEIYGNEFKVYYDDGTSDLAVPTMGSVWLISNTNAPDPEPEPEPDGTFIWPFNPNLASSEYGPRDGTRFHEGIDLIPGVGAPIPCSGDGTVVRNDYHSAFGNVMIVFHGTINGKDAYTVYAHRQTIAGPGVGQSVAKSQIIGTVGNTGQSYGAHLHWETHLTNPGAGIVWNIYNNGGYRTAVNPRVFMSAYGT